MGLKIVSFQTALEARNKGFVEGSNYYYDIYTEELIDNGKAIFINGLDGRLVEAPYQALLTQWIREKQNLHISVKYMSDEVENNYEVDVYISYNNYHGSIHKEIYATYEEALEGGLIKGLELIK